MAVYNDIYRLVVLEGPDLGEIPAGISRFIGTSVLDWSAFSGAFPTIQAKLDQTRAAIGGDYLVFAKAFIAQLFHYKIEELDEWDSDKLFQHIVMAEMATGRKIEPLDPLAEEEKKKNPNKKKDEAPKNKPELNKAQKMVLDRVRKARGA